MSDDRVRTNAWTGMEGQPPVHGRLGADRSNWSRTAARQGPSFLRPPAEPDPADWRDARIGWGVVLPARSGMSAAELASGSDAPPAIQRLIAARSDEAGWQAPILRYHVDARADVRMRFLKNHAAGRELAIVGSGSGVQAHQLPRYLLIAAGPQDVPWELQYILAAQRRVGRLHLGEDPTHYVDALVSGFRSAESDVRKSVTWAVVHDDPEDITHTLRTMITRKVHRRLAGDSDLAAGATFLDGKTQAATSDLLIQTLVREKPALVVTSSHGKTGPIQDVDAMRADLGLPVDQVFRVLSPDALLASWEPDGAIWLAHACCSAGAVASSHFQGLFDAGDDIHTLLGGVAAVGDQIAPLPTRLLAHEKPLRAFIGQVEPTFDWTLRDPSTGQPLTNALCDAVYPSLYLAKPVGLALESWQDQADGYNRAWLDLKHRADAGEDVEGNLLAPRLAASDVESTVLLGDPTAALPEL